MTTTTVRRTRDRRSRRRWRDDPAIKLAHMISQALARTVSHDQWQGESAATRLFDCVAELDRCRRRIGLANAHGLAEAQRCERQRLARLVREVTHAACDFSSIHRSPTSRIAPSAGFILTEIRHLQDEFPSCDITGNTVSITTSPITLEGVYLGEFRIELNVARVRAGHLDGSAINAVALDPHPAVGREDVTHPHVAEEGVCLGDATAPLARALADGRLAEVFMLVNAVLHTYNSGSPYIALAEWEGISCGECGSACSGDETYFCPGCETEYCGDCVRCCNSCERSYCSACLQDDAEGESLCHRCRGRCGSCGTTTRQSELDERGGVCAACEERDQEQDDDESVDDTDDDEAGDDADDQLNQQEISNESETNIARATETDAASSIEHSSGASPVTIANASDAVASE